MDKNYKKQMITVIILLVIAGLIILSMKLSFTGISQFMKSNKIHFSILSIINLIIIGKLLSVAWNGNDKSIFVVIFGYSALIILNALTWLILVILKSAENKIYKTSTIGLAILFIPTLLLSIIFWLQKSRIQKS